MAVKLAKAMGNTVVVFSTSPGKRAAVEALGAQFVNSKDPADMAAIAGKMDFIIDTASADHDISTYMNALAVDGKFCVVGLPQQPFAVHAFQLVIGRKTVCGSLIGGIKETQETLDFCAAHGIAADIQLISPKELNHAMVTLAKNAADSRRFVIDMAALTQEVEVEADASIDPASWKVMGFVRPPDAVYPAHAAK
uniref:Alcohol dehydrogenase-like C-terminal domain-containing protein n=1 Tax=Cryptomonas curvata TaxID=233186 RepID=A0A6T7V149_9CRYP|mmetsp:Transcript_11426/g.24548  ORF Transcript_11426/g.24548 Transcript_11426/m.24548 type:complete len:195 (+) Transcript_11426:718-1302(+)